jgi:hypothetical protein
MLALSLVPLFGKTEPVLCGFQKVFDLEKRLFPNLWKKPLRTGFLPGIRRVKR